MAPGAGLLAALMAGFFCLPALSEENSQMQKAATTDSSIVKVIALLAKREDISRDQFRHHYENNHVPLAADIFAAWPGYIRNHIDQVYPSRDLDFDVLTMFWYKDLAHLQETVSLLSGERGQRVRDDEQRFMSKATNRYYQVEEYAANNNFSAHSPWQIGSHKDIEAGSKIIALVPSAVAGHWRTQISNFANTSPGGLIAWVNNHISDKPDQEFEEITEMWFSNRETAELAIYGWLASRPQLMFIAVTTFDSSRL